METDEAIDEEAHAEGGGEAVLDRYEVWEDPGAGSHDAGIDDERDGCQGHVNVEECRDLLPSCDASKHTVNALLLL